jgi:WD40 repeat protein
LILCIDFTSASGSYDGSVKLWDLRSNIPLHTLQSAHSDKVLDVDFHAVNPELLASASSSSSADADFSQTRSAGICLISGGADNQLQTHRVVSA